MSTGDISRIKNYLSALSPKGLRRKMFENNRINGVEHDYSTPHFIESEKKWYVWFNQKIDLKKAIVNKKIVEEVVDG